MSSSALVLETIINCPVCGSDKLAAFSTVCDAVNTADATDWKIVRCGICDLTFADPRPTEECWERLMSEQRLYFSSPGYVRNMLRRLAAFPAGSLLDIGCGRGDFLAAARSLGWQVTGIELAGAENPYDVPVVCGSFEDVQLPPASFDVITFWGVTEYLRNPLRFFARVRDLLKDTGAALFVAGNAHSLQRGVMRTHNFPRQQVLWSRTSLSYALRASGLAIDRCDMRDDIRYGGCAELVTFGFKRLFQGKTQCQVMREHNRSVKERSLLMMLVKVVDRLITWPLSTAARFAGYNGVMNFTVRKK